MDSSNSRTKKDKDLEVVVLGSTYDMCKATRDLLIEGIAKMELHIKTLKNQPKVVSKEYCSICKDTVDDLIDRLTIISGKDSNLDLPF